VAREKLTAQYTEGFTVNEFFQQQQQQGKFTAATAQVGAAATGQTAAPWTTPSFQINDVPPRLASTTGDAPVPVSRVASHSRLHRLATLRSQLHRYSALSLTGPPNK